MTDTIASWLADPDIHTAYLVFALAVMIVPMIALAKWYHGNVGRSAGGRALMKEHNAEPPIIHGAFLARNLAAAIRLYRRIASGVFGREVQRLQSRVYLIVALWIVANVIVFGILIWADLKNAKPPG